MKYHPLDAVFAGRVVIITGAGHGLGLACASALLERGARVIISDAGTDRHGNGSDPCVMDAAVFTLQHAGGTLVAHRASLQHETHCR